jgi:hypothetical protein
MYLTNPTPPFAACCLLAAAAISSYRRLVASGEVSGPQLTKGFQRVTDNLPDTLLDNPAAGVSDPGGGGGENRVKDTTQDVGVGGWGGQTTS